MSKLTLSNDFPLNRHEDWQTLVEKGLRGADFDSLVKMTEDELTRGPLSTASDRPDNIAALPRAGAPLLGDRPWHITAPVRGPDIAFANTQMLADLNGGASSVRITLGANGVTAQSHNDIKRLMDRIYTDLIPITIAPNNDVKNADLFQDYKDASIYLGLGPKTEGLAQLAANTPSTWRLITINAARVHDTGGTDAQELAYFAASAAYAYRTLGKDAAKHIGAELTANQDGHMSIAKLRAARRIYARISESFGVDDTPLSLHVISSKRMMQSTDPWTNMLRVMSAGFGAVIGGADFITLRPFTDALGTDALGTDALGGATPFGYRIARNMQLMMMEESHLGQVQDAAFGSYFHERMTDSLSQTAWAEFQQIESDGGIDNITPFKARIQATAKARVDKADPILGVTLHPTDKNREAKRRPTSKKGTTS